MKLIEWGPFDTTRYDVTAAELRELVLECIVAYAGYPGAQMTGGSVQTAEWARAKKLGTMIRTLTCRE